MGDPDIEQRRRQMAGTTLKQRLLWVDDALRLAGKLQCRPKCPDVRETKQDR